MTIATNTLASHITQHAESNDLDNLRPDWRDNIADIDEPMCFTCVLPRDFEGTTDDIESAIDDARRNVVRKYLRAETDAADIEIYECERDGYAVVRLTGEGIEVQWTVEVEIRLAK